MATAVPSSPPDDLFSITVERAKAWGVALGSYIGSIAALIGGYYGLKNLFPDWSDALVVGIAAIPLVLALVTITLPTWLRRRRDRKLIEQGVSGALQNPGYFRIQPYAAEDRERFWRPDGAQDDVLNWILNAESPVLYLTGRSGTGKSSLLNAWVLPKLRENDLPFQALVVRSYRDPLAALGSPWASPG